MKRALQNALLVLASFGFLLGAGELVARALLPPQPIYRSPQPIHDRHPTLGWVLRPGQNAFTHDRAVRINGYGLRDDDEVPVPKPSGERRVLLLGDSVTFGNGVATEGTYSEVLERELRSEGWPVRVLNAGVQGYDVHQEAAWLLERGLALEPDVVVVGFYENDVVLPRAASKLVEAGDRGGLRAAVPDSVLYGVKRLRSVASLALMLREARWRVFPPETNYHVRALFFGQPSPESERAWAEVERSLRAIAAGARAHGSGAVLLVFPHHGQLAESALDETYQGRLLTIADRIDLRAIDLRETYRDSARRGEDPFIPFDGHPSAVGHRLAAEALRGPVADALAAAAKGEQGTRDYTSPFPGPRGGR